MTGLKGFGMQNLLKQFHAKSATEIFRKQHFWPLALQKGHNTGLKAYRPHRVHPSSDVGYKTHGVGLLSFCNLNRQCGHQ
jgi:hypothetical protein